MSKLSMSVLLGNRRVQVAELRVVFGPRYLAGAQLRALHASLFAESKALLMCIVRLQTHLARYLLKLILAVKSRTFCISFPPWLF